MSEAIPPGPVLVGELNPYGSRPEFALYDSPEGSAGERMRRMVCGLRPHTYRALSRHNLCVGEWSGPVARASARHLSCSYEGRVLVLLGRKVASAFGLAREPAFSIHRPPVFTLVGGPTTVHVLLPHPSGLCREWHEPGAFARARGLLREACPWVPWGEALDEGSCP